MTTRSLLAAAGALLLFPQFAIAEEPVETALREMVAALDASPEWVASFGTLSYDALTETATITDFAARTEKPGTEISVARISVTGYSEAADGTITAGSAIATGGVLKSGFVTLDVDDFGIEDLTVPVMEPLAFDSARPFTSIIKIYNEAIKADFSRARVGTVVFVQKIDGVDSRVIYENLRLDGFSNGKVASMRAGPLAIESPSPEGLVNTTVGSVEGSDIDLAAILRVYDPNSYEGGVGDMEWRNGMRHVAYDSILMDLPGAKISIDSIEVDDTKVRQPPTNFAYFLDIIVANPNIPDSRLERLSKLHLPELLGAWSIGELTVSGFVVDTKGIDHLAFGRLSLTDLSIDGLGEFAIEDLGVSVRGEGAMRLGRFAFGDIPIGGIDGMRNALRAIDSGEETDPAAFIPTPGFLEIANAEIQTPDIDRLSLNRFRVDLGKYIGIIPTTGAVELSNLVMPTSAVDDRQMQQMLRRFGYEEVDFSAFVETEWLEADETLAVKDLRFDLRDMGSLAMNFVLQGFPLEAFQDDAVLTAALPDLNLVSGELTFTDKSMVGNGLDLLAEQMNAPPEAFRQQFADAIPFFLSMATINDPQLMALIQRSGLLPKLTPVVRDFVAAPGASITFAVDPQPPVSIPAISQAVETAPDTLVDLLGLTVTGTPGVMPEEPAVEPAPEAPSPTPDEPGAMPQQAEETPEDATEMAPEPEMTPEEQAAVPEEMDSMATEEDAPADGDGGTQPQEQQPQ